MSEVYCGLPPGRRPPRKSRRFLSPSGGTWHAGSNFLSFSSPLYSQIAQNRVAPRAWNGARRHLPPLFEQIDTDSDSSFPSFLIIPRVLLWCDVCCFFFLALGHLPRTLPPHVMKLSLGAYSFPPPLRSLPRIAIHQDSWFKTVSWFVSSS